MLDKSYTKDPKPSSDFGFFYRLFFVHRIDPFIFDHVEPFVGFGDLGGGHLDHVGQGGLCANRRKLIYHEDTLAWKTRFVKHFLDNFLGKFSLDGLDCCQGKIVYKRKIFLEKKLDKVRGSRV